MKLTENQGELINLLCANIINANIYCESLISDNSLPVYVKSEVLRPMHTHLKFLHNAINLRVSGDMKGVFNNAFGDSMVYDEVIRLMVHLPPKGRTEVEDFIKSKFSEYLL